MNKHSTIRIHCYYTLPTTYACILAQHGSTHPQCLTVMASSSSAFVQWATKHRVTFPALTFDDLPCCGRSVVAASDITDGSVVVTVRHRCCCERCTHMIRFRTTRCCWWTTAASPRCAEISHVLPSAAVDLFPPQELDEAGLSHGECSALMESYALALALLAERAAGPASKYVDQC